MATQTQIMKCMSHMWLVLWLVAFPLVHIHPEADHAHGSAEHAHGGLVHSVLSKDLACEFHDHTFHHDSTLKKDDKGSLKCEYKTAHALNHEEIEFSLLSGWSKDSSPGNVSPVFFSSLAESLPPICFRVVQSRSSERSPPSGRYGSLHHIRPPPAYAV